MGRYKKILVQPQRKPTTASLSNKSQTKKKYFSYTPTTTISDLPNEMLLYILSLLPQEVILSKVNVVCKRWNQLTKCASFWKRVVLNDKMSRQSINRWILMAPQLKHLVVRDRDNLSAILNTVSQNCKHLETLEVYNCVGSSKYFMVNSLPMCNLISRCSKLHNIQFHQTAFKSCKFFKLLPKKGIGNRSKPCCYGGPISAKQLNAFLKSIKQNKMENTLVLGNNEKLDHFNHLLLSSYKMNQVDIGDGEAILNAIEEQE